MKKTGKILIFVGVLGLLLFGLYGLINPDAFEVMGIKILFGMANWIPIVISIVVLLIGVVLMYTGIKHRKAMMSH